MVPRPSLPGFGEGGSREARGGWGQRFLIRAHPTRRLTAPPSPQAGRDAVARSCASTSIVRFTFQTATAPPPLFSQGAGSAGLSIPSSTRGNAPSPKVRGAERRKARVTVQRLAAHAQCDGRSPRGAPLRRVSLDLETAFSRRTGAARRTTPLIPRDFTRVHPPEPAG